MGRRPLAEYPVAFVCEIYPEIGIYTYDFLVYAVA